MAQTQTSCPRCRQPIMAQIEQLFDVNEDPQAKQRLLSGQANYVRCPHCGYEGMLSLPIVYHDNSKELLLTYFPPDLGVSVNEQEKLLGPMITKTVNRLAPEQRKAYVLRPQGMLTMQTMIEKVLEGDGITREEIQKSQQRMMLLERLMTISPASRADVIKQEEANIDQAFFMLLSRIMQATLAQGDQNSARVLAGLQQDLLTHTALGQELKQQSIEIDNAVKALQAADKEGLTREKLLDILIGTSSDAALSTIASMARGGLDYTFFELLSNKIDQAGAEEKEKLAAMREKLLLVTSQIDQAMQAEMDASKQLLEAILKENNIEEAVMAHIEEISDFFVQILKTELDAARKAGDLGRSSKIQQIVSTLQKASAPPPEVAFIDELMSSENEEQLNKILEANSDKITPEFLQLLNSIATQAEQQGQQPEVVEQVRDLYRAVLRFSMKKAMK
ncbi:MAG: CpXC domain-containing protein [Anaerolineae bacterium]|nr:CpXC domain-containing protein [Anaerolineae bacterium]